jgi:23S rRNA (uracil1939-C5)-methyltransferase
MALADVTARHPAVSTGDIVPVRVRALASSGNGVADLPDGRVAFVPRTAPGDVVEVRVGRMRKRWAEAILHRTIEAAPGRVAPPCPLFDRCGGCALQHLDYASQLGWKGRFVADAMKRIGGMDVEVPPVEASPLRTRYRNRLTFTLRRLRGGRIVAGFHALHDPDRIVDVDAECLLPEPPVLDAWSSVRAALRADPGALPPARELRLTLRATEAGALLLLVRGGAAGWDPSALLARVEVLRAVWHLPDGHQRAALVAGEILEDAWGGRRVPVGGRAFVQVNRAAADAVVAHVLATVGEGATAVDAYCGVGVYGRALARRGWRVTGIEWDAEACAAAGHEAPEGFRVVEGPVEAHLPPLLPTDLVVLNPPRTGLEDSVPEALNDRPPARVVYVSCDPATLARDARRLRRFRPASLRCFDLFPQTAHVETVAVFVPEG